MLVYAKSYGRGDDALPKIEGGIEDKKTLNRAVYRGKQCLVGSKNDLFGCENNEIKRIGDEVVDGNGNERHKKCAEKTSEKRARTALFKVIDDTGDKNEGCRKKKVGKLANTACGGKKKVYDVFDKTDSDAEQGSQTKGAYQCRQIGKIELHKGRDQKRKRKLKKLQNDGYSGKHCRDGDASHSADIISF